MSADFDQLVAALREAIRTLPELQGVPQRIYRPGAEMRAVTGLGATAIADLVAAGKLRPPVKLSERAIGFLAADVLEWQRERERCEPPKPRRRKRAPKNGGA